MKSLKNTLIVIALATCINLVTAQTATNYKLVRNSPNDQIVKEFRVSTVGQDKSELIRVLEAIQKLETLGPIKSKNYEVMQRINLREFLVYAKVLNHTPVVADSMARIGGGGGVSGGGSFWKTDRSQIYWLITKTDHDVADHEELQDIDAEPTGKTREYTTASGAKATVRELAETDNKKAAISKEEFIIALKAGKVWTLKRFSEDKCFRCFGSGKLGALQKYAKCADCDGTGVIESDLLVKW